MELANCTPGVAILMTALIRVLYICCSLSLSLCLSISALSFPSPHSSSSPPSTALISWSPSTLFIPCLQDWFYTLIPSLKRQTSQQLTSKADLKYLKRSPFSFLIGSNRFLTGREKKVDWISPRPTFRLCPSLPPVLNTTVVTDIQHVVWA